jgi:sulfate/thiosulfate transport system substrate-binding protein
LPFPGAPGAFVVNEIFGLSHPQPRAPGRSLLLVGVLLLAALGCSPAQPPGEAGGTGASPGSSTPAIKPEVATPKPAAPKPVELLIVSFDATRELWVELGKAFSDDYLAKTGQTVSFRQSQGGSPAQARALCDGLEGDLAALALPSDFAELERCGVLSPAGGTAGSKRLVPCTSTIVFLVREGNPKRIADWPDLLQPEVTVVSPSPRTSGVGRMAFLSAWAAISDLGGSDERALAYVTGLYQQITRLEPTARAAANSFLKGGEGDVLLALESEAYLEVRASEGRLEVVYPRVSLLVETPVAVVDRVVDRNGTRAVAEAFHSFLETPQAQAIFAKNQFRPMDNAARAASPTPFPEVKRIPITDLAASWDAAQTKFFGSDGLFEKVLSQPRK